MVIRIGYILKVGVFLDWNVSDEDYGPLTL